MSEQTATVSAGAEEIEETPFRISGMDARVPAAVGERVNNPWTKWLQNRRGFAPDLERVAIARINVGDEGRALLDHGLRSGRRGATVRTPDLSRLALGPIVAGMILLFLVRFLRVFCAAVLALAAVRPLSAQDSGPDATEESVPEEAPLVNPEDGLPEMDPAEADAEAARQFAAEMDDDAYRQIQVLAEAIQMIRQNYVDEGKVSYERLIESALEGMFAGLDPHSQYMHRRLFEQMSKSQTNTYNGVGISISFKGGSLRIVAVREEGSAARAGVLPGDEIIRIGETLTEKLSLEESTQLLSGNPGETLSVVLRRPATGELLEKEMVREVLQETTVKDVMLLEGDGNGDAKIGYCRLLQFNEPTARELSNALDDLEVKGMRALVLDLRNNPGGLLSSAVDVCAEFVPPNTTVVTTEGRIPSQNPPPYKTRVAHGRVREYPMAILVDASSASASEVVSGALQDLHRAIIVGVTTFGKGSVQSIIPMGLGTGAAMRLTTAKYYTPSHKVIHGVGVTPNLIATLTPKEEEQLALWRDRATLDEEDTRKLDGFTDRQLERAVDALRAVLVFEKIRATPEPEDAP